MWFAKISILWATASLSQGLVLLARDSTREYPVEQEFNDTSPARLPHSGNYGYVSPPIHKVDIT